MQTYAHIETGVALDPRLDKSAEAYYEKSSPLVRDEWHIVEVRDGTLHGATPDGQGGWDNPESPPPPTPQPKSTALDKDQFLALLTANKGSLTDTLDNWPEA